MHLDSLCLTVKDTVNKKAIGKHLLKSTSSQKLPLDSATLSIKHNSVHISTLFEVKYLRSGISEIIEQKLW